MIKLINQFLKCDKTILQIEYKSFVLTLKIN